VNLDREEYIEQAYFFRAYRERVEEGMPAQHVLSSIHEEILATTRLPMAIEFLRGEMIHHGLLSTGMKRLSHYFTAFQAYVLSQAEDDRSKLDQSVALEMLQKEAEYRAGGATPAGLFVYQFESISRNKLGYEPGLLAVAADPMYDPTWSEWIKRMRLKLGTVDFGDLIWFHSEQWVIDCKRHNGETPVEATHPLLFGAKEGRIAAANRGRDPLHMFAALQRHLGYPTVPRSRTATGPEKRIALLEQRSRELEKRLQLLEAEAKGQMDLSQFYVKTPQFTDDGLSSPG
jgi:hypothetical protein